MVVRTIEKADIPEAVKLIREGYEKFVSHDYTPQGSVRFFDYVSEDGFAGRIDGGTHFSLVAVKDGELIGIIEMKDFEQCTLFYVNARFHGQGIGRWLFDEAVAHCRASKPSLKTIKVNSSTYAVTAYKKLGFKAEGMLQEADGVVYQPMIYEA